MDNLDKFAKLVSDFDKTRLSPTPSKEADTEWLDDILKSFAIRFANMSRGKTYGWEDEKQAILERIQADTERKVVEARIDELESLTLNSDMTPEWLINRIAALTNPTKTEGDQA